MDKNVFIKAYLDVLKKNAEDGYMPEKHADMLYDNIYRCLPVTTSIGKTLLVEEGSVDVDKLEADGFYVITYRHGSNPPKWLL